MRLGDLLIADGLLDARKLAEGLERQAASGGRLGTNLIELGHVDEDGVARALSRQHRVPAALARHLARHDRGVLSLVPADLAARAVAIPVAYAMAGGRRLVVCMRDPTDDAALRELAEAAGLPLIASVAPETAVYFWLERCYGVARPRRFLGELAPDGDDHSVDVDLGLDDDDDDDAPPAPAAVDMPATLALVDLDDEAIDRDLTQYALDTRTNASSLDLATRGAVAATPAISAAPPPADDPVERPTVPPPADDPVERPTVPPPADDPVEPPAAPPPADGAIDLASAIARIAAADRRAAVTDAVIAYLRGVFGAGLLVIIRDDLALGYKGFGGTFDAVTVESILIPLSAPSIFSRAHAARAPVRETPSAGVAVQDRFFKLFPLLDGRPPAEAVVAPVVLGDRVVSMLYAHGHGGGALADGAVDSLSLLTAAVEDAYLRLIREAKQRG